MLVLTRRKLEQLVITLGDQTVFVRVVDIGRDRVRLGVSAPKEVAVHREEVARRIEAENRHAIFFNDPSPLSLRRAGKLTPAAAAH
jgi:carbon storage regulator